MDLVVDEVEQLQDVDLTDGDRRTERLAGATIEQDRLAVVADLRDRLVENLLAIALFGLETQVVGAFSRTMEISSSRAPSNTGVATWMGPSTADFCLASSDQPTCAAQPRCVSSNCPMFIRLGTPRGLRMMSTDVPSARNGMSSIGRILEMTPLLP